MKLGRTSVKGYAPPERGGEGERNVCWDNLKGILILLVVLGHCLYGLSGKGVDQALLKSIYFFHMPAFIFVSGYWGRKDSSSSAGSLIQLGLAYLLCIFPFVLRALIRQEEAYFFTPVYSSWYLAALFIWRLVTPKLAGSRKIFLLAVPLSLLASYWSDFGGAVVLALGRALAFWPFYLAGYFFSEEMFRCHFRNLPLFSRVLRGGGSLLLAGGLALLSMRLLGVKMQQLQLLAYQSRSLKEMVLRLVIFEVALLMIGALLWLVPEGPLPFLTRIGRHSLSIYLLHRIFTVWF